MANPRYIRVVLVLPAILATVFSFRIMAGQETSEPAKQSDPARQSEASKQSDPAPNADSKKSPGAQDSGAAADKEEVTSHETAATFKVRVNLVLVRVVVRDNQGKIVTGLKKEDFQLFDNRKAQVISSFGVETPASLAPKVATAAITSKGEPAAAAETSAEPIVKLPQRFVALVFDDVHLSMEDANYTRGAATRFFGSLSPSDRVGIFTTSGQFTQQFTDDHELLKKGLQQIIPRSPTARSFHDCPDVSYYQADLIENRRDDQALAVAAEDAVQCAYNGDESKLPLTLGLASGAAARALSAGDEATEYGYRHFEDILRRLSSMPGQRVMVFVSPGFIPTTLWPETSALIDRATKDNIIINTIDARGLYAPDALGDIADPPKDSLRTRGYKGTYRVAAQFAQGEVLGQLADGTGGTFFHNRNDVDQGLREAVAAPPLSYVLGFSPQNLKIDGRFHTLKISFSNKEKYAIQARRGYYAPRVINDPAATAKQEIREALFSQEEIHDVPVDLQTQFFKTSAVQAKLSVLTRFDVRGIHFRKSEGRNRDDLTIATAIFDENGNFVTGGEKIVQMKLLDTTYDRLSRSGLTLKSSYDVKPGSYLVRMVVRDAEGAQLAARNGAVVIPN